LIGRHRPSLDPVFAAEQAWQVPVQALSQQTPSTQLPVGHATPAEQAAPGASLTRQLPVVVLQ
jgi:hypothetical protein